LKKENEQLKSELKESLKEDHQLNQTLSQIQNLLIQSTNESTNQLQSSNLSSISTSFQESLMIKLDDINQHEITSVNLINIHECNTKEFSVQKASETINIINN
jgi:hypothetical protein